MQNTVMAKDKKPTEKRVRRGRTLIEVRSPIAKLLEAYAASRAKDNTEAANELILEALSVHGFRLQPPPSGD